MKIDREYAIIDLDEQEVQRYHNDVSFQNTVTRAAEDLSDEVKRTVEVYTPTGERLDVVSNYG